MPDARPAPTPEDLSLSAAARFHLRIGQAGSHYVDRWTIPLFPLPLILDADGTLAEGAIGAKGLAA